MKINKEDRKIIEGVCSHDPPYLRFFLKMLEKCVLRYDMTDLAIEKKDMVSEAYIRFAGNDGDFKILKDFKSKDGARLSTYIFSVVKSVFRSKVGDRQNKLKSQAKKGLQSDMEVVKYHMERYGIEFEIIDSEKNADEKLESEEQESFKKTALNMALGNFSGEQRLLLQYEKEGKTTEEILKLLPGLKNREDVYLKKHRAIKALKKRVKKIMAGGGHV